MIGGKGRLLHIYEQNHAHPVNRIAHMFGVPAVAASLIVVFFSRRAGLALFAGGWTTQLLGHAIQGTRPSFVHDPRHLLIGPTWVARCWLACFRGEGPLSRRPRRRRTG
jgi:uncharacterized membrane protein YGL010W